MRVNDLKELIEGKKEILSKATEVRTLIQKQKKLMGTKKALADFKEPVLILVRRTGIWDFYENATAGKFVFEHSNGKSRFIELRPSDQGSLPYGDKRIRGYVAHEDRPYAGWDEPIVDSESVMLGYEKTKATDLKYQEKIESLKRKSKQTWIWLLLAAALAAVMIMFGWSTFVAPILERRAKQTVQTVVEQASSGVPSAGVVLLSLKRGFKKWKTNGK